LGTRDSLREQGENFQRTRDGLVEMTRGGDEYSAYVEDASFGVIDAEAAKALWDEKNRHNIQQYAKYKSATDRNVESLTKEFEAGSGDSSDSGGSGDSGGDSTGKEWVPGPGGSGPGGSGPGGYSSGGYGSGGYGSGSGGGSSAGVSSAGGGAPSSSGTQVPSGSTPVAQHSDDTTTAGFGSSGGVGSGSGRGSQGGFGPLGTAG